jgi:short subunit dehydrogenase-like uncharacterized protein
MPDTITPDSNAERATSQAGTWMLYGAAGYTGALIAQHACERGHRPVLAGRTAPAVAALAGQLGLPHQAVALDDQSALNAALAGVDLVLNAAGPFLHTAAPLAKACLSAGVHYLDIGNELQVFAALYDLDHRAQQAGVTIMPGVGFGVVATNTRQQNMPYGGWVRRAGYLEPCPLGSGIITITLPDGPCLIMPLPTGDLEAAFQTTGAADITAYGAVPGDAAAGDPQASDTAPPTYRSFGWARATGPDGATAAAWLQAGESYAFTAAASIRAIEETLARARYGALSPAAAFGADFALTIPGTSRTDTVRAQAPLAARR